MTQPHRPVGGCSPNRVAALKLLDQYPTGKHSRDAAVILEMTPKSCARMFDNLRSVGLVKSIAEGNHEHSRRVRYYLPKHEAAAIAANRATRGVEWGRGRSAESMEMRKKSKKRTTISSALQQTPRKDVSEATVTVCPSGKDHRFTVHNPQPLFSSLPVGTYLPADTWASKAYA